MFHELSHLLIKPAEIDGLNENEGIDKAHKIVEMFANHFAAEFLVPATSLLSNPLTEAYLNTQSDYSFQRLKCAYRVSGEVILRRLLDLGKISSPEYKERIQGIKKALEEYKRKLEAKNKGRPIPRNIPRESFQKAGRLLTSKAFLASEQGKISIADISKFYEVKQIHIKKIKGYLDSQSGK